ncbi:MAG: hypothetical protein ACXWLM_02470, partial [Myxococcales bacterium]
AKEPAYLSVKFSPETVRFRPAGKDDGAGGTPRRAQPVTAVLCVDGLPCVPLLALGAIRVRLPPPPPPQVEVAPAHAGISNLEFAIAADRAGPWEQWFRDFVTDGDNDDSKEKSGTLIYLDASRERELARVDFFHLGIFKLTSDPATNDEDKIKRVRVALYVEQLDVRFGGFCERCD